VAHCFVDLPVPFVLKKKGTAATVLASVGGKFTLTYSHSVEFTGVCNNWLACQLLISGPAESRLDSLL
jgi:hypothetical protein